MTTPSERRVAALEAKLTLARAALKEAQFAIDSAIMLQGLTALQPYATSVATCLRDLEA